jgi:acyl-CoA synthetase (AMP-forming)/AMP-acid ligase II
MYHYLLGLPAGDPLDLSSLRACLVTGSVTPASLREAFGHAFGARLVDSYGSTETCGAITMSRPDAAVPSGSCGQPVPGLEVRLVHPESGRDVGPAGEGEVWVRGPNVTVGYHSPVGPGPSAVTPDGWYRTGDLARQDEDGFLTISGRIKDLIIRGGENIHPAEIEAAVAGWQASPRRPPRASRTTCWARSRSSSWFPAVTVNWIPVRSSPPVKNAWRTTRCRKRSTKWRSCRGQDPARSCGTCS